jgi:hypothetical protein
VRSPRSRIGEVTTQDLIDRTGLCLHGLMLHPPVAKIHQIATVERVPSTRKRTHRSENRPIGPFSDGIGRGTDPLDGGSDISSAAQREMTKVVRETAEERIPSTVAATFRTRNKGK